MQRSREASAEAARRQEEERLARWLRQRQQRPGSKEEKALSRSSQEAARVAALERAEQAAAARAAAKAARERKRPRLNEQQRQMQMQRGKRRRLAKKKRQKLRQRQERHAKEAEALNQASLESRTEAGHTSRTRVPPPLAPTGAVRAMESEHLCPMAAVSCAPPFQKRLSPRPATHQFHVEKRLNLKTRVPLASVKCHARWLRVLHQWQRQPRMHTLLAGPTPYQKLRRQRQMRALLAGPAGRTPSQAGRLMFLLALVKVCFHPNARNRHHGKALTGAGPSS